MQMLGAFADDEREMVKERTRAGLKAASAQGRHGESWLKFTPAQRAEILSMLTADRPAAEVARLFQVHRATICRLNAASRQAQAVRASAFMLRSKNWPKIERPRTWAPLARACHRWWLRIRARGVTGRDPAAIARARSKRSVLCGSRGAVSDGCLPGLSVSPCLLAFQMVRFHADRVNSLSAPGRARWPLGAIRAGRRVPRHGVGDVRIPSGSRAHVRARKKAMHQIVPARAPARTEHVRQRAQAPHAAETVRVRRMKPNSAPCTVRTVRGPARARSWARDGSGPVARRADRAMTPCTSDGANVWCGNRNSTPCNVRTGGAGRDEYRRCMPADGFSPVGGRQPRGRCLQTAPEPLAPAPRRVGRGVWNCTPAP
jgi:hypothetical protein